MTGASHEAVTLQRPVDALISKVPETDRRTRARKLGWGAFMLAGLMSIQPLKTPEACVTQAVGRYKESAPGLFRISTFNIARAKWGAENVGDVLSQQDSQVICLQEVTPKSLRTILNDTGMRHVAAGWAQKNYGNAILTELPITKSRSYDISGYGKKDRVLVTATVKNGHDTFVVAATHLTSNEALPNGQGNAERRERQARNIMRILNRDYDGKNIILCGDLNATPDSDVVRVFDTGFSDAAQSLGAGHLPTYPSTGHQIDYIKFNNDAMVPLQVSTWGNCASDHRGVTAVFKEAALK
jgi:endonuclease/exonuclease/phosphatase family metal-dependent hydrolase